MRAPVTLLLSCIMFSVSFSQSHDGVPLGRLDSLRSLHPDLHTARFGYAEYQKRYPRQAFLAAHRSTLSALPRRLAKSAADDTFAPVEPITRILVIAQQQIYAEFQSAIERYAEDIRGGYGCEVVVVSSAGGTAVELKELIRSYRQGLNGVVGIGELPICYFNYAYDSGYEADLDFICDYFFMDLDGEWLDLDHDGVFDDHRDGAGDVTPEIFFARIDPAKASGLGDPREMLRIYFDKNHAYWTGEMPLASRALAYVTEDWTMYGIGERLAIYGPGSTDIMYQTEGSDNPVSAADFLANRIPNPAYSYINQWIHSGSDAMAVYGNGAGTITALQIAAARPQAFAYNLMSCHSCQFVNHDDYCIGMAYVFNAQEGSRGLCCLGPTKSAGMCRQESYWEPYISQNYSLGQAFSVYMHQWRKNGERFEQTAIDWAYCVTIIGDPLIMLTGVPRVGQSTRLADRRGAAEVFATVKFEAPARLLIDLPEHGAQTRPVEVRLYDLHGRIAAALGRESASSRLSFDLREECPTLAGGMYLCRMAVAGYQASLPIMLP